MKRTILLGLLLSACASGPPASFKYPEPEALDANGLPPLYSLCVRNAAMKSVAIYDVHYGCQNYIISYVSVVNGISQQAKAEMVDAMEPKAMDYAQRQVIDRHGEPAVRAALMGLPPPPRAVNRPVRD